MTVGRRTVATIVIAGLGVAIGAAVLPFLFGLLGAPILAVTFTPLHRWLQARTGPRRAAAGVVVAGVIAVFLPAIGISLLIISELPTVLASPDMGRIIGKRGRVIQALRQVGRAAGSTEGARITVDVAE